MSKLDDIIFWADYPDGMTPVDDPEFKQQLKDLMLELVGDPDKQDLWAQDCEVYAKGLIKKIEAL